MLTLQFKEHAYQIPNQWEELNTDQFIYLIDLLNSHTAGELTADMVRTLFFLKIAGIKPRKIYSKESADLYSENIYRISRNLTFMFRVVYDNAAALRSMESDYRNLLERYLPEELEGEVPELRVARKLKKHLEIDAIFAKNLIPEIRIRRRNYPGFKFDRIGGILNTDLPAGDFINASTLHDLFMESGNQEQLDMMISILYKLPAGVATKVADDIKAAVLFNFRSIMQFISQQTQYGLLWNKGNSVQENKISIGFVDSLYSLSKAGYGDASHLKSISLVEFLDLLLKEVIDTVKSLQSSKMDMVKISEITKLSINQIQSIL